jgi:hypothetical protein
MTQFEISSEKSREYVRLLTSGSGDGETGEGVGRAVVFFSGAGRMPGSPVSGGTSGAWLSEASGETTGSTVVSGTGTVSAVPVDPGTPEGEIHAGIRTDTMNKRRSKPAIVPWRVFIAVQGNIYR